MNVCLVLFFLSCSAWAEDTLKAVTVLFRHGDRTPQTFYPTDPYSDPSFWPVRPGQLTNIGKNQHYKLGTWFRNRYDGFLSDKYDPAEIRVRTSDLDRCHMSAACNLAALYMPKGDDLWNAQIPWQPIPIHSVPTKDDDMLKMDKKCAKFSKLLRELLNTDYFREIDAINAQLYEYLSVHSGLNITTFTEIEVLFDTLFVEQSNGMTLPEWTRGVFPDKMFPLFLLDQLLSTYTPAMARLKIGTFLNAVLKQFESSSNFVIPEDMNDMPYRKFMMYSAHDTTVRGVLRGLKINDGDMVPYAAALIVELFEKQDGDNYVRFFYKNGTDATQLHIGDCEADCPLNHFRKVLKPLALTSAQRVRECEL